MWLAHVAATIGGVGDILRHGREGEPKRWASPTALAVASVTLLVAVAAVRFVVSWHPGPPGYVKAAVTPSRTARATTVRPPRHARRLLKEPVRLTGVVTPSGGLPTPLLLNGNREPGWFWPATDRFQAITGLPRSRWEYSLARVPGGWAAQSSGQASPHCQTCFGAPTPVYFIADGAVSATRVGVADSVAAGTSTGSLWLTTWRPGADLSTSGTAQQVTGTGQALGPPVRLPPGYGIERAVSTALLLTPNLQGPGPVFDKLLDPGTGRVIRVFSNVIAVGPNQIAWHGCPARCALKVLNLPAGTVTAVPQTLRTWVISATFDATGRLLAAQEVAATKPSGEPAATRLEVINTVSGHVSAVPGTLISTQVELAFGWYSATDRLLASVFSRSAVVRVGSWQSGGAQLSIQTVRIPAKCWLVIGEYG